MIGTAIYNRNVFHRLGDALNAFKTAPTPAQLYAPQQSVSTGFLQFPGWSIVEQQAGGKDERNAKLSVTSPWVYRDINAIAKELSTATLDIKERQTGNTGDKDIENHPLEVLWENPNEYMGRSWLMQFWTWQLLLYGEAYLYLVAGPDGQPVELWPLPSLNMTPIPDETRFISGYLWKRGSADKGVIIDTRPIIYSRLPNPFDIRRGLSPLAAMLVDIEGDLAMAKWNKAFFGRDNGLPAGLLGLGKDTLDTDVATVRQEVRDFYGSGQRRVAVARAGDMSWTPFDRSQKDMEFAAGRKFTSQLIDTVFGIPEGMWSEKANRANSEGAKATFIENAVWPLLVMLSEDLNSQLLPLWYGDDLRAEFADIRPRNKAQELQTLTTYQGFYTVDELRELTDMEKIGDLRGDMLIAEIAKGVPTPTSIPSNEQEDALAEAEAAAPPEEPPPEAVPPALPGAVPDTGVPPPEGATPPSPPAGAGEGVQPMKSIPLSRAMLDDWQWNDQQAAADLSRWQSKATKALKAGKSAAVKFESGFIPIPDHARISEALKVAETPAAVSAAFKGWVTLDDGRHVLIGGGDNAAGGGGGGAAATDTAESSHSSGLSAALDKTERSISIHPFETAAVFDQSGNLLLQREGGQHQVSFTDAESGKMKGAILTHNHPSNVSFSRADVQTHIQHEIGETRAVTGNHRYSLRTPPGTKWTPALESHIQSRYNGLLAQARADVAAGKRTVNDVNRNLHHELWTTLAHEQGWSYSRTNWG